MSLITKKDKMEMKVLIEQIKVLETTMTEIQSKAEEIGFNYTSCVDFARKYQFLLKQSLKYINVEGMVGTYNIEELPNPYNMMGIQQMQLFQSVLTDIRMLRVLLESDFDYADDEVNNIDNLITSKLRLMFNERPENEKEVQDNLEKLFIGSNMNKGIDYDRETGKFKFSGREYIPDFIFPKLNCCLEVKIIKEKKNLSSLIEQINADITAYSKKYTRIFFVVYDLGVIKDVSELKRDIESSPSKNIKIIVIKQ